MAEQGAALQTYNNELVKCLEELCERRTFLQKDIDKDEQEKLALELQLKSIQEKLSSVNTRLGDKLATKAEYDKTISESEQAYMKILESSQVLLNVVKRDAASLQQKSSSAEKTLPLGGGRCDGRVGNRRGTQISSLNANFD